MSPQTVPSPAGNFRCSDVRGAAIRGRSPTRAPPEQVWGHRQGCRADATPPLRRDEVCIRRGALFFAESRDLEQSAQKLPLPALRGRPFGKRSSRARRFWTAAQAIESWPASWACCCHHLRILDWNVFGPGPTDFAGPGRVALGDIKL